MKIHYTSGTFYLLQDWPEEPPMPYDPHEMYSQTAWSEYYDLIEQSKAKKIKIANPELLPVDLKEDLLLWEGDSFDLHKELSVEVTCKWNGNMDSCGNETCWDLLECQKNPAIAILSKSNSPEIPDSSDDFFESDTFKWPAIASEKALRKVKKEVNVTVIDGKSEFCFGWRKAIEWANETYIEPFKKFIYPPSPPTVAGTSTEQHADFIDGSTYVKPNDSKVSNSSEKPDFMKMANECHAVSGYTPFFRLAYELGDKIWNDYVTPRDKHIKFLQECLNDTVRELNFNSILEERDKTISDLRERVKELEQQLRAVVRSYDANEGEIVHPIIGNIRKLFET